MKYNASANVLNFDGTPITNGEKEPATFAELVRLILVTSKPKTDPKDKLRVYEILEQTHESETIELSAEDISIIKQSAEHQSDAIYGAIHKFLENPTQLQAVEK